MTNAAVLAKVQSRKFSKMAASSSCLSRVTIPDDIKNDIASKFIEVFP